jgi:hypothetical protein
MSAGSEFGGKELKKEEPQVGDTEKTRYIEALRTTLRSLHSNGLVTTFEKCMEIVVVVRKISAQEVRKEDLELMRDLAAKCDSFLTHKIQILRGEGVLDFSLLVPGSVERIRRDLRVENLIMNYVAQAQLFAELICPWKL